MSLLKKSSFRDNYLRCLPRSGGGPKLEAGFKLRAVHGHRSFPKNLEAISKFWALVGWHEARSHTGGPLILDITAPGARDLCTLPVGHMAFVADKVISVSFSQNFGVFLPAIVLPVPRTEPHQGPARTVQLANLTQQYQGLSPSVWQNSYHKQTNKQWVILRPWTTQANETDVQTCPSASPVYDPLRYRVHATH